MAPALISIWTSALARLGAGLRGCWLACLPLAAGCLHSLPWTTTALRPHHENNTGVAQVHVAWDSRIHVTEDVGNQGAPLMGAAGRMYLFGPNMGVPLKQVPGKVTVDMFDATNGVGPDMPWLERWNYDAATLQRLQRKDMIGWGYTLFLPSDKLRPDMTQVQIRLCFTPDHGTPMYAPPSIVSLRGDGAIPITQRQVVPGKEQAKR